jgi:tripeptide aminopeptidase
MRDAAPVPSRFLPFAFLGAMLLLAGCEASAGDPSPGASEEPEVTRLPEFGSEMERIGQLPAVEDAFRIIEELEETTATADLIYLTEIPAPPFMEEERARAFAEMIRAAGADSVWIDAVGNVLGLRRGTSGDRTVALDGHLDTVFPIETDVTVVQRGDTLFAPGIGDDTRGLVSVLNVLRALEGAGIRTEADVLFIGTVGEEGLGDLRGVKHLFGEDGPGIDSWIAIDGGDERRVKVQAVGSHRYRVTYEGPGGHSWGAFGLGNPHHALGRAIRHFSEVGMPYTEDGPRTSFSVGRTGGGTSVNSIPFESWMEVDMRSLDPASLQGLDDLFQEAVQRGLDEENAARRRGDALTVTAEMVGNRPAGTVPTTDPLIQRAIAATDFLGVEPALSSGSTNSNIPMSLGVPATTIGRGGDGGGAHALGEWWLPVHPDLGVKKALLILLAEAGVAGAVN